MLYLSLTPIFIYCRRKAKLVALQILEHGEIVLCRLCHEVINIAKSFEVLLKLHEICVCFILYTSVFMRFPIFERMYKVIFEFYGNKGFYWTDTQILNPPSSSCIIHIFIHIYYSYPFSSFGDDSWFNNSGIFPAFRERSATSILVKIMLVDF